MRPSKGPTVSVCFLTKHFCDTPTCSFHHNLFLVDLVIVAQRSKPSKCAPLSLPKKNGPIFSVFFLPSIFVMPQTVAFTKPFFWSNWSSWLRDPSPPSVLDYLPKEKDLLFDISSELSILVMPKPVASTRTSSWSN